MKGLKEFKESLLNDKDLEERVQGLHSLDELVDFAAEMGYKFSEEELESLADLSGSDLKKVAGGTRSTADRAGLVVLARA